MKLLFDSKDSTLTLNPLPLLTKKRSKNRNRKSNWIHVDPCEAAVDENFIYESWGKSQNYIISVSDADVRDVTEQYTRNFNETVLRRSNSEVNQTYLNSLLHDAENEIRKYTSVNLNGFTHEWSQETTDLTLSLLSKLFYSFSTLIFHLRSFHPHIVITSLFVNLVVNLTAFLLNFTRCSCWPLQHHQI